MPSVNLGRIKIIQRGAYLAGTTYQPLDMVTYNGLQYICKATSTGNLPSNTSFFDAIVDVSIWSSEQPAPGKIPLADAQGKITHLWVALTPLVEQSDIGTAPNQVPRNGDLGSMAYQSHEAVRISGGVVDGQIRRRAPVIKTAAFTVADNEHWLICNGTASIAVTLPDAATNMGREIMLTNRAAFTVVSASSNVVPLAGGAAGTAILAAAAGKYATLVSDGTNWIITQAN